MDGSRNNTIAGNTALDQSTLNERLAELRNRSAATIETLDHVLSRVRGPVPQDVSRGTVSQAPEPAVLERSIGSLAAQLSEIESRVAELSRLI